MGVAGEGSDRGPPVLTVCGGRSREGGHRDGDRELARAGARSPHHNVVLVALLRTDTANQGVEIGVVVLAGVGVRVGRVTGSGVGLVGVGRGGGGASCEAEGGGGAGVCRLKEDGRDR